MLLGLVWLVRCSVLEGLLSGQLGLRLVERWERLPGRVVGREGALEGWLEVVVCLEVVVYLEADVCLPRQNQ